jgi:hypothetical protein
MMPPANLIGRRADAGNVVRFQQRGAVCRRQPFSAENFVQDWLNVGIVHALSLLTYGTILKVRNGRVLISLCAFRPLRAFARTSLATQYFTQRRKATAEAAKKASKLRPYRRDLSTAK